jgi:peptidoglycan/LPS O-acetylase OafA/YrhL
MRKLLFVEGVRGACASYVFATHVGLAVMGLTGLAGLFFRFGQEAVMVFFIMSGFVIMVATEAEKPSFQTYFQKRWIRIYPIFAVALIVTVLAGGKSGLWQLIGNIFMLQDSSEKPGTIVPTFGGNAPMWSLSYEWWFYMLFWPVYRWVPQKWQTFLVTVSAALAWIAYTLSHFSPLLFIAYWPVWWAGAEIGRAYASGGKFPVRSVLSLGILVAQFFVPVAINVHQAITSGIGMHPILEFRHAADCLIISGMIWTFWRKEIQTDNPALRTAAWLGSISYALYVFHFPIATSALWGATPMPIRVAGSVVIVFVLAVMAEKYYQPMMRNAFRGAERRFASLRPEQAD